MIAKEFIDNTADHVQALFDKHTVPEQVYHNLEHTKGVVKACEQIADHYQLEEEDFLAVMIASWYHDVGYLYTTPDKHEEKGAELAYNYVIEKKGNKALAEKVKECILATKMPQKPTSLISRIVCDADLFHLGTEEFLDINKRVRKEHNSVCAEQMSNKEWRKTSLILLEKHQYHTDYCKTLLQTGKQKNINILRERIIQDQEQRAEKQSKKEKKNNTPSRGIETMFRTTSTNHLRLSEMADSKANIMITVNSIIASILVSVLFRKLEDDTRLVIPAILFLGTSLVSIIFAILVTRPNVTQGTFTKEDIDKKRANLLFFGNFHKMKLKDYQSGINAMMNDSEFLYGSMTRDIYNLGVVLGRKYRLLRITYSVFMFGFVLSILAFVIAVTMFEHP